jgi:ABC-type transport system substrate-binding protein
MIFTFVVVLVCGMLVSGCGKPEPTTVPATTTPASTPAASTPAEPTPTTPKPTASGTPTAPVTAEAQSGGVLKLILNEGPQGSIGIPENMLGFSSFLIAPVFEAFVRVGVDGSYTPVLAESWDWSDDFKTLTLHLRKGVKFHDGSDFNAEVAKWNVDQRLAAKVPGSNVVVSTEVIDDYTFQINISTYQNIWFNNLGATMGTMISKTAFETKGAEWLDWNPVGTGPFKFKQYKEGEFLEMERFDGYWGKKPYLDGIKNISIADPVTAQIAFEAGESDVVYVLTAAEKMAADLLPKGYKAEFSPGLGYTLIPSSGNPESPFSDPKVRMATEYAINKEKITETIGQGYWIPMYQIAGHVQSGYIPDIQGRTYDPAKAKQLLEEAGYPNGFTTKLMCGIHLSGDYVEAIQADLLAVGIDAQPELLSIQKWIDLETNGWTDGLMISPVTTMSDYGTYLTRHWITPAQPGWGSGNWWTTLKRPAGFDDLVQELLLIPDAAGQKAKAQEITQLMFDNVAAIPLWETTTIIIMQPYVHDMQYSEYGWPIFNFTGAWIEK